MLLNDYLSAIYPGLDLAPGLFYRWNIGIRFELGINYDSSKAYKNSPYLQDVYHRAITLFQAVNASTDELILVVDVNEFKKHKVNVFSKYVKDQSMLYHLQQMTIPDVCNEDDDEPDTIQRFTLHCRMSDIKYMPMLKAICNQDMAVKPSISHCVYSVNISKNTIFYVYDDRGCDLIASDPESIRPMYCDYNDWILDYDREAIDKVFKK
ncbi:MAG: DUF3885 domain-containing protein [Sporolactobacillus sp.]